MPTSPEITVAWDASATPGVTYNIYRGQTPGSEGATPFATGVTQDPASPLTAVAATVNGLTVYTGTPYNGTGDWLEGDLVDISGFAQPAANGRFKVRSSAAGSITVESPTNVNAETAAGSFVNRPYFTDTSVVPGQIYVYRISAVKNAQESLESVEVISEVVPYGFSPLALGLGEAATSFEVLAGSTATNVGASVIHGEVGVSPGTSLTGFGAPAQVTGQLHAGDFVAAQAQLDLTAAFNAAMASSSTATLNGDIGGMTLAPGVYTASSSMALTGQLYLDAGGNPDAVWIFQIGSTFTMATASCVMLLNGAQPQNVFWAVGSSATLNGPSSSFVGTIMAQASISVTAGVNVNGRLLARVGAVTLIDDVISLTVSGRLRDYAANTAYLFGDIVFDCVSGTFQQVLRAGSTGASRPTFTTPNIVGSLTTDGSVIWESLDHSNVVVVVGLPPAPPNTPPAPPAAPTNPAISSET